MARKLRLAPKRQAWADQFKPATLRGATLPPPVGIEARYSRELLQLVKRMTTETERAITRLFESPVAVESHVTTDASIASQARILTNALTSNFIQLFKRRSRILAERMVGQAEKASETNVRASLRELSGGVTLTAAALRSGPVAEIAKASIVQNVALIRTIPETYFGKVQAAVMRSIATGNGLQDLTPFFAEQKGITERHARNMALDQTRKAYQSINRGRMEAAGVKRYEWVHSGGGQKPRPLHVEMSGKVYSFDDPPVIDDRTGERGIPGQAPNCRCTMRPILEFAEPAE